MEKSKFLLDYFCMSRIAETNVQQKEEKDGEGEKKDKHTRAQTYMEQSNNNNINSTFYKVELGHSLKYTLN